MKLGNVIIKIELKELHKNQYKRYYLTGETIIYDNNKFNMYKNTIIINDIYIIVEDYINFYNKLLCIKTYDNGLYFPYVGNNATKIRVKNNKIIDIQIANILSIKFQQIKQLYNRLN